MLTRAAHINTYKRLLRPSTLIDTLLNLTYNEIETKAYEIRNE
jgi:hypothetical protein